MSKNKCSTFEVLLVEQIIMFACKYVIFLFIIFYKSRLIGSCGCYGSDSCTPSGDLCYSRPSLTADCLCHCCTACNTCKQLLEFHCASTRYSNHYSLSNNQSTIIGKENEELSEYYVIDQTNGERLRFLWDPCLRRSLPRGIHLVNDTDGSYKLTGIAREKINETLFEIVFKAPVGVLISLNFTLSIV